MRKFDDIDDAMEGIKHLISHMASEKMVVVKAIPMKKEWIEMKEALHKDADKVFKLKEKLVADKKKMWAVIELEMNDFGTEKRLNPDTNEIEILGEKGQENLIRSPYLEK